MEGKWEGRCVRVFSSYAEHGSMPAKVACPPNRLCPPNPSGPPEPSRFILFSPTSSTPAVHDAAVGIIVTRPRGAGAACVPQCRAMTTSGTTRPVVRRKIVPRKVPSNWSVPSKVFAEPKLPNSSCSSTWMMEPLRFATAFVLGVS